MGVYWHTPRTVKREKGDTIGNLVTYSHQTSELLPDLVKWLSSEPFKPLMASLLLNHLNTCHYELGSVAETQLSELRLSCLTQLVNRWELINR